jgi:hypothetical protein
MPQAVQISAGGNPGVGCRPLQTFGSRPGGFARVAKANLRGGLYFRRVYTAHSLTLVVATMACIDLLLLH